MSIDIAIIALVILILCIVYQFKVWKFRALLSPGIYFSLMWSLGIISSLLYEKFNMLIEPSPQYIDELNLMIAFTGFCFLLFTIVGKNKVNAHISTSFKYISTFNLFKNLSLFYFVVALYTFITQGYGLDFAAARDNMHETIANRSVLVGYVRTLNIPLSIFAGSKIVEILTSKLKIHTNLIIYTLPFLSGMLFSFTEGGRIAMVYSMLYYVIGAVLSITIKFDFKKYKKIFFLGLFVAVLINVLITVVADARSSENKYINEIKMKEYVGPFSFMLGAAEYVSSSYVGYQFRRYDYVNENELGYGKYTFNGFINWQLPFANQIGIFNKSIAEIFDLEYNHSETYNENYEYYYVTSSCFLQIYKDFGKIGSYVAIFFIVLISHLLFVKIQKTKTYKYASSFYLYYLFLQFWACSNFSSTMSVSVLLPLYSFLIVDILNYISKRCVLNNKSF